MNTSKKPSRRAFRLVVRTALAGAVLIGVVQWARYDRDVDLASQQTISQLSDHLGDPDAAHAGLVPEMVARSVDVVVRGGGLLHGGIASNALEAFEASAARGVEGFEADFAWTSDHKLVLSHDWGATYAAWHAGTWRGYAARFLPEALVRPTEAQFLAQRLTYGATPLNVTGILSWLAGNENAILVADVRENTLEGLALIAVEAKRQDPKNERGVLGHIWPQVYRADQIKPVRDMGYQFVIYMAFTQERLTTGQLVALDKASSGVMIAIPLQHVFEDGLLQRLRADGSAPLVYVVNDPNQAQALEKIGAFAVYSDTLYRAPKGQ